MKKLTSVLLTLSIFLCCTSCNNNKGSNSEQSSSISESVTEELTEPETTTESTTIATTTTTATTSTTVETTVVTTEAPTVSHMTDDVYINAKPVTSDGKVKFEIETNLPDGTELTVYLCQNDFVASNDAKAVIKNGVCETSELSKYSTDNNAKLISGDYDLIISMYSSHQSDNVKKVIGEKGEYLKGNIVEKADYGDDYNVYKSEKITLTFEGSEESAEYINKNLLEDVFAQIDHRINYIEFSNTYYIQIWFDDLSDNIDNGIPIPNEIVENAELLCKSALELCQSNDSDCSVHLEVIDDPDEDTLLIGVLNGTIYYSVNDSMN